MYILDLDTKIISTLPNFDKEYNEKGIITYKNDTDYNNSNSNYMLSKEELTTKQKNSIVEIHINYLKKYLREKESKICNFRCEIETEKKGFLTRSGDTEYKYIYKLTASGTLFTTRKDENMKEEL